MMRQAKNRERVRQVKPRWSNRCSGCWVGALPAETGKADPEELFVRIVWTSEASQTYSKPHDCVIALLFILDHLTVNLSCIGISNQKTSLPSDDSKAM